MVLTFDRPKLFLLERMHEPPRRYYGKDVCLFNLCVYLCINFTLYLCHTDRIGKWTDTAPFLPFHEFSTQYEALLR